nr:hypothetical protein [Armatimonadota bacterium]
IQWGFWQGAHWRANEGAAPFRQDWSKRPAEVAYEDLVLHQWWTHAELQTGADGRCATRAFYGVHQVSVVAGGHKTEQEIQLAPGGSGEVVIKLK